MEEMFDMDYMESQRRQALLIADCEKSVGIILEFIQELETLQTFMNRGRYKEGIFMAQRCCYNSIIACDNNELPTVGLRTVQNMILNEIIRLDSTFCNNVEQGIYNIAADGNCSSIINVCNQAIIQLRKATL